MDSRTFFYEFGKMIYRIDGFYSEYAKKLDVKENLLWILYALNDGKAHSQKEICESWDLPRSTVNTIMKELEDDGYVDLIQIKGEKRELQVCLTRKGIEYSYKLLNGLYEIERKAFEELINTEVIEKMDEVLKGLKRHSEDDND